MSYQKSKNELRKLISAVRGGDQAAFVELLDQYKPLIDSSVSKFASDETFVLYRDDLRQEASVVFYNSILAYDLEQTEVEFGLYAKICIYNALVSQLRSLKKKEAEPIDQIPDSLLAVDVTDDPAARILEQERIKAIYSVIRSTLSDFEYKVWQLYVSGRSAANIANQLGIEQKSVANAVYRIRKKLRARLDSGSQQ